MNEAEKKIRGEEISSPAYSEEYLMGKIRRITGRLTAVKDDL